MEGCKCKPAKSYAERIIEYQEFVSLVKRMREAQIELEDYDSCDGLIDLSKKVINLESEVDEYLNKMEV